MQVNRLFEIVYILLNKKSITARELSDRLEVSVRTIYRDIETLCLAGVPVYMSKGRGGGIRLLDHFVLNKTVLSDNEQNEILAALQSLSAINYPDVDHVISKLGALFNKSNLNWMDVDFSHWGSHDKVKFNLLKTSIISKKVIIFNYSNSFGEETSRRVEPLQLWFKDKSWYLKGYCLLKQAFRIFKLTRIKALQMTEQTFDRVWPQEPVNNTLPPHNNNMVHLKINIQPEAAYRVYDEFDGSDIVKNQDGSFTVNVSYPENEWVYGYILSFGSYAEVLEPLHVRNIIGQRLEETLRHYR